MLPRHLLWLPRWFPSHWAAIKKAMVIIGDPDVTRYTFINVIFQAHQQIAYCTSHVQSIAACCENCRISMTSIGGVSRSFAFPLDCVLAFTCQPANLICFQELHSQTANQSG